jgi:1-deoxy-D-xylulose-5-phosphate reductoisomerase
VVSAIVGVAGLEATHAAILAGKPVGLANKECMVAAGEILTAPPASATSPSCPSTANTTPSTSACASARIPKSRPSGSRPPAARSATPARPVRRHHPRAGAQAPHLGHGPPHHHRLRHHAQQGLEIIEACRLFDVPPSQVRVTVHPQSTVHSLVEYVDGSILAQISVTDMRLPILYALAYPERPASTLTFDLAALRHLDFESPISSAFPACAWP